MSTPAVSTAYDERPYPWLSHGWTHPGHIGAVARLLGMSPASPHSCRVLELGCASGGNLIPLAEVLPDSRFLGCDLASTQIEEGRRAIAHLGLGNIDLQCCDLTEFDADRGQFDYILAHGLFSWVPDGVRRRLLELCSQHLAPHGVAFISYNVYPGWHFLGAVREMLLYHTRNATDSASRAKAAREFISFFVESVPADAGPWAASVHAYWEQVAGRDRVGGARGEDLLLHDELAEINEPFYFKEFARSAAAHGLQYLADADFASGMLRFAPAVQQRLLEFASDPVEVEQYADFLRARTFRQSLICRADVGLRRRLQVAEVPVREFHFGSSARLKSRQKGSVVEFETGDGRVLKTNHPVSGAAMHVLIDRAPEMLGFDDLLALALKRARRDGFDIDADRDSRELAATLLKGFLDNMALVEIRLDAPDLVRKCSARPAAGRYARWRASEGDLVVTNRKHQRVEVNEITRKVLTLLDGTRTVDAIWKEVAATQGQQPVQRQELSGVLQWCASAGLFRA